MFFSLKTAARETETDEEMTESTDTNANKMMMKDRKTAAESDMKTEKKDRQTVTAAVTEAVTMTAAETVTVTIAETDIKMKKVTNFESRTNIRLLAAI